MNTLELLDKKQQLKQRANELITAAETAVRKMNEGEQAEFESILKEIEETDVQIRKIETENLKQTTSKRSMEKFSLLKAINDVANNRQLDEKALEVVNAGITEMRKAGQNYSG